MEGVGIGARLEAPIVGGEGRLPVMPMMEQLVMIERVDMISRIDLRSGFRDEGSGVKDEGLGFRV